MCAVNDNPRVSVVVPTYRRPQLLVEALGSILGGSYSDLEVLVVNDGVEDDLAPARSQYPDPRVRWITRPQRLGMLVNLQRDTVVRYCNKPRRHLYRPVVTSVGVHRAMRLLVGDGS